MMTAHVETALGARAVPPLPEGAALMARVAGGDDVAFTELYGAHRQRIYRLAYGVLLDEGEAREAVQEVFIKLHEAAHGWEPRAAVGTWLYRVTLNHCLSARQRLLRLVRSRPPASARGGSPEAQAALGEAVRVVARSLGELPPRQRAVACLFLEAELAPGEIAPLVGMTPNAARVALHRALSKIRGDLGEAGIDAAPTPDEMLIMEEAGDDHAS